MLSFERVRRDVRDRLIRAVSFGRDEALIRRSGLFDSEYYREQVLDPPESINHPIRHYLRHGAALGLDPHPLFHTLYYVAECQKAARSPVNPLVHYLTDGGFSGYDPCPQFDSADYLGRYPDVAAAGINPLVHYVHSGLREGRAANSLVLSPRDPAAYRRWLQLNAQISSSERRRIVASADRLPHQPRISVAMNVRDANEKWLRAATSSIVGQLYQHWQLCIVLDGNASLSSLAEHAADGRVRIVRGDDRSASPIELALQMATGDYIAFVGQHDELSEHALYMIASELRSGADIDLFYTDEDQITEDGAQHTPVFKPDWDPELIRAGDFLCRLTVVRRDLLNRIADRWPIADRCYEHDLVTKASEVAAPSRIRHVPHVLYHRRSTAVNRAAGWAVEDVRGTAAVIEGHLTRLGIAADVSAESTARVRYRIPSPPPLVSAIIPTRDQTRLLQRLIDSLLQHTNYPHLEVIIASHRTTAPSAVDYLRRVADDPRLKVIQCSGDFNFSAINNLAVCHTAGSIVALLNDDIEARTSDWLTEMVSLAIRPDVGVVGCHLRYPDARLQHAGVVFGMGGVAGHLYQGVSPDSSGRIAGLPYSVRSVTAVTFACAVMRRTLYDEVGGLDEEFASSFNDIDFCLRVQQRGYRNLVTPFAELIHHEGSTRGRGDALSRQAQFQREVALFRTKWGHAVAHDPYYSPNLSLHDSAGTLAVPPRVPKLWPTAKAHNAS